jgi:hypothetical protein
MAKRKKPDPRKTLRDLDVCVNTIGLQGCGNGAGVTGLHASCGTTGVEDNPSVTFTMRGTPMRLNSEPTPIMSMHATIQEVISLRDYLTACIDLAAESCPICKAAGKTGCAP